MTIVSRASIAAATLAEPSPDADNKEDR
jgi:hypothetical protein